MVSEEGQANLRKVGLDTSTWLGQMIEMDNALIRAFPDVTFAVHLCRGNHRSMWSVEGGYDAIAEQLFNDLAVDRILAEYDSPRAGSFAPLRFVPEDKTVVLGLDHDEGAGARGRGPAQVADRRGVGVHPARPAGALARSAGSRRRCRATWSRSTTSGRSSQLLTDVARDVWR